MSRFHPIEERRLPPAARGKHPLFPKANGCLWNPGPLLDEREKWIGQFLDAYFGINLAYARLVAFRKMYPRRPPQRLERPIVEALEDAFAEKERLENCAAAFGLIASPIFQDGFTIDLHFGDVHSAQESRGGLRTSSASARLKLRLPIRPQSRPCKS